MRALLLAMSICVCSILAPMGPAAAQGVVSVVPNLVDEDIEKKFAKDEDLKFAAYARRNKLIGLWAAERLGKSQADAVLYARQIILADAEEPGEKDIVRKILTDLKIKNVTEAEVVRKMRELLRIAVTQIQAER